MKDVSILICEDLEENFLEETENLSEFDVGLGAIAGVLSGSISAAKLDNIINNLKLAKEKCDTDQCKKAIQAKIEKYEAKREKGGSSIRRGIGGLFASSLGVVIYHLIDKAKKKKDVRTLIKLLNLKAKLKECRKNKDTSCEKRIADQIYLIKNAYSGKARTGTFE